MPGMNDGDDPSSPSTWDSGSDDDSDSTEESKIRPGIANWKRVWKWLDLDLETVKMMAK
jgi:hypothetical protein